MHALRMRMSVVQIRHMWMVMSQRMMHVTMTMWTTCGITGQVLMLMVIVMVVSVFMFL